MGAIFDKPDVTQVKKWYNWVLSLNHTKNPFHPEDGGKSWQVNNNDKELIWLAGVTARTPKEATIPDLDAIITGSLSKAQYDNGGGKLTPTPPTVVPRKIEIEDDKRNLYIPIYDELATPNEYSGLTGTSMEEIAQKIIDREDNKGGVPPASVELDNKHKLNGNDLKPRYRFDGTIDIDVRNDDNVFLLPAGKGTAAFCDYAVILNREALTSGTHMLKFGATGRFFGYTVEYEIKA